MCAYYSTGTYAVYCDIVNVRSSIHPWIPSPFLLWYGCEMRARYWCERTNERMNE